MNYEPRGKVKNLIDAMRAAAAERPVWTSVDVAAVLQTSTASVPAFVDPSIRHGVLFRKLQNGRSQYSLQPFAPAATAAPMSQMSPMAPRETTATGWNGAVQFVFLTGKREAKLDEIRSGIAADMEPRGDRANRVLVDRLQGAMPQWTLTAVAPSPQPTAPPAPAAADASIPQAASAADVTWNVWEDGDMDLHGLVELENGGYRMPAEAVARLRKFIAWMPA